MSTAALVLAAGAGRRYGGPKALVRFDGELLVERAVRTAREAGCAPVAVVIGAAAEAVRARADLGGARLVANPRWPTGMGSSLRAGLEALADGDATAVVVLLVDMPGVTTPAVARLASDPEPLALRVATYGGRRGHPVLLGRAHWPGVVAAATGDMGARGYLADRAAEVLAVPCDDIADGHDVDVPADLPDGHDVDVPADLPDGTGQS
ncbi:NTP transferase domain-containing protein [Plantactinospora sp. GCM10030261]|uniref:nucleotidyltransferase family protein n=1 Tax=Plantactinospora sp. GCM10030261 TaxID=3273420 RepID=UPI003607D7B7